MKKIEFFGNIKEEIGVIMAFSKIHKELGFIKLVPSSARGFDIGSIEYKGHEVAVEFEYLSSNFLLHRHQENMEDDIDYVVICWEDDCNLRSVLRESCNKNLFDIIEIRKYVNIINDKNWLLSEVEKLKYVVLSYNPKYADNVDFGEWAFCNCFTTTTSASNPKFANDKLPQGSKILFYRNGYIIGSCTVVRYEVIEKPQSRKEWNLYKKMMDYPVTPFTLSIEDYQDNFTRGHIFYSDFKDIRDFKIKLSNITDKNMSNHGKINLTKEEYYSVINY